MARDNVRSLIPSRLASAAILALGIRPSASEGQIQDGLQQHLLFAQKKRDQEPAYAPVAVEEGVYGLELGVR